MKLSKYQIAKKQEKEAKAVSMYKQGCTLQEIGDALGRSNTWAWLVMRKYSILPTVDNSKK